MIAVRLMGGLGNQMFQYALGRRVSLAHKTTLVMDKVFFENVAEGDTPRHYELDCFSLSGSFLEPAKRPIENPEPIYVGLKGTLRRLKYSLEGKAWNIYREPGHNFDPQALQQPNGSYFIGYWQTEKYFADIRSVLLKDFSFRDEPSGKNKELLEKIRGVKESVSLHVRRGDYVTNPNASKFHGTKGMDYYSQALEKITSKYKDIEIFVFSDDPEWCKQNLKFEFPTTYVEGNKKGYEDMRLMMNCKHNIIANSSFSWWAAWLNQNPEKIVVGPKKWFNDPSVNTDDVLPKTWIQI